MVVTTLETGMYQEETMSEIDDKILKLIAQGLWDGRVRDRLPEAKALLDEHDKQVIADYIAKKDSDG